MSLDANTGHLLETRQGTAGLHLTRQMFDHDGQCIEYAGDV
jgi:DNA-binding GntR family transcriptional regulator